uniref:tetratricopeptide repeat protein 28 n=1 Tax=Ciona intestinalis TaxID=7719 RepID=UPI0002B8CF38|nr:tetratricopeptide repeat protein 28 [Ciona intestinalis]|eukprot:XP_026690437.1 tetratricopeptide repeat protein 28 [Ciona intestinalis]
MESPHKETCPSPQDIAKSAKTACSNKQFELADQLYTEAISHQPNNAILYCNRSVVKIHLKKYEDALQDANTSIRLNRMHAKGYFHGGVALKHLGHTYSALVMYSNGMVLDSKNRKFLKEIIETSMLPPLNSYLSPVMTQLKEMNLNHNPFVIISVVGQALLAQKETQRAVEVLECAVAVGTCSLKLKGSVYSTLSNALWTLGHFSRAIHYMTEDLKVAELLMDAHGECRSLENLGFAFYTQRRYQEAFEVYTKQLGIAKILKNKIQILSACNGLERIYAGLSSQGPNSPKSSHTNVSLPLRKSDNGFLFNEVPEENNEQDTLSLAQYQEKLEILLKSPGADKYEEAQLYCDIARAYKNVKRYDKQIESLKKSAIISRELFDVNSESRTLMCLAHAAKCADDTSVSKEAYERMLEISHETKDILLQGFASSHLGVLHHQLENYEVAIKYHHKYLQIATNVQDISSQGHAHGNLGNSYNALGFYEKAAHHQLKHVEISHKILDEQVECSAHGNLAVAYQALKQTDKALEHFRLQLELSRRIKSCVNESVALMNLANCFCTTAMFSEAVEMYKGYLQLSVRVPDKHGEGRALYNLGYAYFSLGDHASAVDCYNECISVASQCNDDVTMARAFCNLGLAKKDLGDLDAALEFQKKFLETSLEIRSARGVFKALGNIGDLYFERKELDDAVKFYQQQLETAQENKNPVLTAQACASLAIALRLMGEKEKAVEIHKKEIGLYSSVIKDSKNEEEARKRLNVTLAETLQICDEAKSGVNKEVAKSEAEWVAEAQAWRNLGITYTNMNKMEQALECFTNQMLSLRMVSSVTVSVEKVNSFCYLGDTCHAMEKYKEAIGHFKYALTLAESLKHPKLENQACKGLFKAYKKNGEFEFAIQYCEQSLVYCQKLRDQKWLASVYGELGNLYSEVCEYDKAVEALMLQVKVGTELESNEILADSASDLGFIYYSTANYEKALEFHYLDLEISKKSKNQTCQGRAHKNLALTYEANKNYAASMFHYEQHLFIAEEQSDTLAKVEALHGIGRCLLMQGNGDLSRAILLLQQSMLIGRELNIECLIASIACDLGKALWVSNGSETATSYLNQAFIAGKTDCFNMLANEEKNSVVFRGKILKTYEKLLQYASVLLCNLVENNLNSEAFQLACEVSALPEKVFSHKNTSPHTISNSLLLKSTQSNDGGNNLTAFFTVTAGTLFYWLLKDGNLCLSGHKPLYTEDDDNILANLIFKLRENVGVEITSDGKSLEGNMSKESSLYTELLQLHSKFNNQSGFLKTGKGLIFNSTVRDIKKYNSAKNPAFLLYELLFSDMEKEMTSAVEKSPLATFTLHIDGDLLLLPFPLLKKNNGDKFLYEKFQLTVLPISSTKTPSSSVFQCCPARALVSGNSGLKISRHDFSPAAAEAETSLVSEILRVEPLLGNNATLQNVLEKLNREQYECIHLACPFFTLPCGVVMEKSKVLEKDQTTEDDQFVLTDRNILNANLTQTKLVVLASPYGLTISANISNWSAAVFTILRTFLTAGTKAILLPLWPVPETACKLFYKTFYGYLINGCDSGKALVHSMSSLRNSAQFQHPSFWAGFALFGQPAKIYPQDLPTTFALTKLLQGNPLHLKDTIKLCSHMLGKALSEKVASGSSSPVPIYTTQESVAAKVHNTGGWRELFSAAGFQLRNKLEDLPAAVVFPQSQPHVQESNERVLKTLKPFANLPCAILETLGQLMLSPYTSQAILLCMKDLLASVNNGLAKNFSFNRKLWQTDGCSQIFHLLGYKVISIEEDQVLLHCDEQLSKTKLQNTIQALTVLQLHTEKVESVTP